MIDMDGMGEEDMGEEMEELEGMDEMDQEEYNRQMMMMR